MCNCRQVHFFSLSLSLCYAKEAQSVPLKISEAAVLRGHCTKPSRLLLPYPPLPLPVVLCARLPGWRLLIFTLDTQSMGKEELVVAAASGGAAAGVAVKSFAGCDSYNNGKLSAEFRHHCISVRAHTHKHTQRSTINPFLKQVVSGCILLLMLADCLSLSRWLSGPVLSFQHTHTRWQPLLRQTGSH